jgi:hypothetical protein
MPSTRSTGSTPDGRILHAGFRLNDGKSQGTFHFLGGNRPVEIYVSTHLDDKATRAVLLHEMVHLADFLENGPSPWPSHGRHFVAELVRLAKRGEAWAAREAHRYRQEPGPFRRRRRLSTARGQRDTSSRQGRCGAMTTNRSRERRGTDVEAPKFCRARGPL